LHATIEQQPSAKPRELDRNDSAAPKKRETNAPPEGIVARERSRHPALTFSQNIAAVTASRPLPVAIR
jgi:hypothetical protein